MAGFYDALEQERRKAQQLRAMQQQQETTNAYNAQKEQLDRKYSGGLGGFLGNIVGGIGKGIGDVGYALGGLFGTAGASVKDILEGKAGTAENTNAFKRTYYGAKDDKDAAAKAAGNALNAATTLATTAVPGLGAGSTAAKVLGGTVANSAAGALGGIADEFAQQGADANFESAANRAISGAVAGLATGGLNRKIGNATGNISSKVLNNKLATSAIGRGALSGAVGGATGAGTSAALGGGDITQAALQGGLSGAVAGGTQAGLMNVGRSIGVSARNKVSKMVTGKEWQAGTNPEIAAARTADTVVEDTPVSPEEARRKAQFELIQEKNPMSDDYHTGIRSVDEIKTFGENVSAYNDNSEDFVYPDWTIDNARNAAKNGKVTIYSSKPIEDGVFVTPSKMMAQDYAGSGQVYSKEIPLDDVAWINGDEGNYAPVKLEAPKRQNQNEPFAAYGESQLAKRTRGNQTAEALRRFGNTLEGAQTNITRAAARDMGIDSPGKVVENVRKKTGLTNLETQAQLARELTGGADSLMDTIQRNALSATEDGSGRYTADTTKLLGEVEGIVRKYANRTNMRGEAGLNKLIDDVRNDIVSRDTDLLSKANNFKASAAELRGKGIVNPSEGDSAKAKIYAEIGKKLDDLSYNAIPKDNVNDMFDATISEMRARATQAQNNGNKEIANAYNNLADNLDKQPRTIKAYRSFKKDFVDISKINRLTGQAENGAGFQMASGATAGVKRFANRFLQEPANAVLATAGGAVNRLADTIDNGTPTPSGAPNRTPTQPLSPDAQFLLGNFIGRRQGQIESGNMVQNARREQDYQNLESMLADMQGGSEGLSMAQNGNFMGGYPQADMSPVLEQMNQIQNAMSSAMAAGDIKAYGQLADMYKDAYAVYQAQAKMSDTGTEGSSLSTAEKNQIAKLQSAGTALDQLESLYTKAGGGQGVIGGNIANFLGGLGLNSDVSTYNQLAQGLINQIGAAIGKTDSLNTEGEVQRALSLVPKITDDNQTAMNKLSTLRQLLQTNTGTYNQLYGA